MVRTLAAVIVGAAALVGALAAAAAGDPVKLALQKADLPAGTTGSVTRETNYVLAPLGVAGLKGASYVWSVKAGGMSPGPFGPVDNDWVMTGDVFVAPNQAAAKKLYEGGKRAGVGYFSDSGTPQYVTSGIPQLGNEQFAYVYGKASVGINGAVFVRKRAVVWQIKIGPSPAQFHPSRAQVLHVLKQFAVMQQKRIGAG
jgi:hypothetical protein